MPDFDEEQLKELKGTVEKITYKNDRNGYAVAIVRNGRERVTAVGIMPLITEGDSVVLGGEYIVHSSYGEQFSVKSFERAVPQNAAAILRYLSSGVIRGVGPSTATRIVEKFGTDTLDIIQNHPEDLSEIRGISLQKAIAIGEEYHKQFGLREVIMMLSPYEISVEKCAIIFRELGRNAVQIVKDNPYTLCCESIDILFEKAERIASDLDISRDNELRLMAGVEYVMRKNLANGHTCLPVNKLCEVSARLLESDYYRIDGIISAMADKMLVSLKKVGDTEYAAIPEYYHAEQYIAARLTSVKRTVKQLGNIDELEIDYVENKLGIKFENLQREAIKQAFESGILILTGGPGTGKTTTLNAIIELFEQRKCNIDLAAPTGRAAKRMTELTNREAKTIHRLLEVEWDRNDKQSFARNERNPLDCDVLIVDEASMMDSLLFSSLLKAMRLSCRLILVGDSDQLPSVSAGNILNDILASECFPAIRLKKVFRQAMESVIVSNAHAIINETDVDFTNKGKDFFFLSRFSQVDVCNTVLELCTERLPSAYGYDSINDIQVLCPSKKYECGTVNLNNVLQSCLNPQSDTKPQFNYKGVYYRKGDKVMQIKNNYDLCWEKDDGEKGSGIFNGDVGVVTDVDYRTGTLNVKFDDKTVSYLRDELSELELAYAVTVHKSQGSEYDCVVLPLLDIPERLKFRNLLYTAITRAKKMLVIVGSKTVFCEMAANNKKTLRYTLLKDFIEDAKNNQLR